VGLARLWSYDTAPGEAAAAPDAWPETTSIARTPGTSTLVMLLHPQCPCSRASVAELGRLLTRVGDRVETHVVVLAPANQTEHWVRSDLWRAAAVLPGVHMRMDTNGHEARRFGSVTSGQMLLYDADGRLRFSGGITASRGHEGDSAGRSALEALIADVPAARTTTPVFGCGLIDRPLAKGAL
jgi:hypothetical protein